MGKKKIEKVRDLCNEIEIMEEDSFVQYVFDGHYTLSPDVYKEASQRYYDAYNNAAHEVIKNFPELEEFFEIVYCPNDFIDFLLEACEKYPWFLIKKIADEWIDKLQSLYNVFKKEERIEKVKELCDKIMRVDNEAYARQQEANDSHNEDGIDAAYYDAKESLVREYPELKEFFDEDEGIGYIEDLLMEASEKLTFNKIKEIADEWIYKLQTL